jgi:hypothetical protein
MLQARSLSIACSTHSQFDKLEIQHPQICKQDSGYLAEALVILPNSQKPIVMTSHFPSIQSFYSREVPSNGESTVADSNTICDGFTSSEIEALKNPLSRPFRPVRDYETCEIAELQTGPHDYRITGRLVNFPSTISSTQRSPGNSSDTGECHFFVICDGSAALAVSPECQLIIGVVIRLHAYCRSFPPL